MLLLLLQKGRKTDGVGIRGGLDRYTSIQWPNSSEGGPGGGKEWKRSEVHVLRSVSTAGKAETDIKERSRNTGGKGKSEMERGEEGDAAENEWSIKHGQKRSYNVW